MKIVHICMTQYSDGWTEAYACGTPVVVSNLTAVPEVVNKNCGMILKQLNVN